MEALFNRFAGVAGGWPLGQPQSPVSPKTGRGVAGCPRGGGAETSKTKCIAS